MPSKFNNLLAFMSLYKPACFAITESWLKPELPSTLYSIPNYNLYRNDRADRVGGGVCLYLNTSIFDPLQTTDKCFITDYHECLWIKTKITASNEVLNIVVVYRPPRTHEISDEQLFQYLENVANNSKDLIIFGDFNFREITWPNCVYNGSNKSVNLFIDFLNNSHLIQLIDKPTRHRVHQNESTLDLIIVSDENLVSTVEYGDPIGISDHSVIGVVYQVIKNNPNHVLYKTKVDTIKQKQLIENYMWQTVLNYTDLNLKWNKFANELSVITENCSVKFPISTKAALKPWIQHEHFDLIKYKKTLWQRFKRSNQILDHNNYKTVANQLTSSLRNSRQTYENNLLLKGCKPFYAYTRRNLTSRVTVPLLRHSDGSISNSMKETANLLADTFESVFTNEPLTRLPSVDLPRVLDSFEELDITPEIVRKQILALNDSSSPGPDNISGKLLKNNIDVLCPLLTDILQQSFNSGTLPEAWKLANVTAIYKKGDKLDAANYRPISLVSILSKILERIIAENLRPFLIDHNVIQAEQFGFMPQRSTTANLLQAVDLWTSLSDKSIPVDVIYLDFMRAFDKVPKRRLLSKLEHFGVRGKLLKWIEAFLTNRQFRVRVGNEFSSYRETKSGVPQGSVLGPLLFLVYVADLTFNLNCKFVIFADDIKLMAKAFEFNNLQASLNECSRWSEKWLIPLNINKCVSLHIGSNNARHMYNINGTNLKQVSEYVDLGVTISSNLSWSPHVAKCTKKANSVAYLIRKAFVTRKPEFISKLFKTYIRPHLEYAVQVWNPWLKKDIELIEKVQRKFTKQGVLYYKTYEDRLRNLKLTSLEKRRQRGDLIFTFKVLTGRVPKLAQLFTLNTDTRLRGHPFKLVRERFKKCPRQKFFSNRVFNNWNALDQSVFSATTVNCFKNKLDLVF